MAYTRKNYLERVIDIQNIVLHHKQRGCTQIWIYENYVKNQYRIGKSTFDNYLSINAKNELKKLQENDT